MVTRHARLRRAPAVRRARASLAHAKGNVDSGRIPEATDGDLRVRSARAERGGYPVSPAAGAESVIEGSTRHSERIRYVEHVDDGLGLFAAAEEAALEGIVAKKALAPYRRGRTGDWIKIKTAAGRALVEDRGKWNER